MFTEKSWGNKKAPGWGAIFSEEFGYNKISPIQ